MTLQKRVAELEQSLGADDQKDVWCIALVGCNPDKLGLERAIRYPVTGYHTSDGKQRWVLGMDETPEQLFVRASTELVCGARKVALLIEESGRAEEVSTRQE